MVKATRLGVQLHGLLVHRRSAVLTINSLNINKKLKLCDNSFHCIFKIQLEKVSAQFTVDKKEMEERHTLVQKMVK